jgi:hypothetical protein
MLRRIPSKRSKTIAFEIEDERPSAVMSISWSTLEQQFACAIASDGGAEAVFDGHAGTIERAAERARDEKSQVVALAHFKGLAESYPIE